MTLILYVFFQTEPKSNGFWAIQRKLHLTESIEISMKHIKQTQKYI